MTSRRNFLGLIAAAPLAGPAMAKAVAEPNLISGMAMARGETLNIRRAWSRLEPILIDPTSMIRIGPARVCHTLDFDTGEIWLSYPDEVPNRLHGVAVNADGDAI